MCRCISRAGAFSTHPRDGQKETGIEYSGAFRPIHEVLRPNDGGRFLIKTIETSPGKVTVLASPMTNIAIALRMAPDLHRRSDGLFLWAGS